MRYDEILSYGLAHNFLLLLVVVVMCAIIGTGKTHIFKEPQYIRPIKYLIKLIK